MQNIQDDMKQDWHLQVIFDGAHNDRPSGLKNRFIDDFPEKISIICGFKNKRYSKFYNILFVKHSTTQ